MVNKVNEIKTPPFIPQRSHNVLFFGQSVNHLIVSHSLLRIIETKKAKEGRVCTTMNFFAEYVLYVHYNTLDVFFFFQGIKTLESEEKKKEVVAIYTRRNRFIKDGANPLPYQ